MTFDLANFIIAVLALLLALVAFDRQFDYVLSKWLFDALQPVGAFVLRVRADLDPVWPAIRLVVCAFLIFAVFYFAFSGPVLSFIAYFVNSKPLWISALLLFCFWYFAWYSFCLCKKIWRTGQVSKTANG